MNGQLRNLFGQFFLWLAVIWWAIWDGGQVFNALMIVPVVSAHPPQSLLDWRVNRQTYVFDFFRVFNTLWIFLALLMSLLAGWKFQAARRRWLLASMLIAVVSVSLLLGWMVPTIHRLITPGNGWTDQEVLTNLHRWTIANWLRIGLELCGLVFALIALKAPIATSETERARAPRTAALSESF
jgi:hypothetical protein